jgi:hypothetical protein
MLSLLVLSVSWYVGIALASGLKYTFFIRKELDLTRWLNTSATTRQWEMLLETRIHGAVGWPASWTTVCIVYTNVLDWWTSGWTNETIDLSNCSSRSCIVHTYLQPVVQPVEWPMQMSRVQPTNQRGDPAESLTSYTWRQRRRWRVFVRRKKSRGLSAFSENRKYGVLWGVSLSDCNKPGPWNKVCKTALY